MEVNPRYTASAEIIERACGAPLMAWHVAACRDGTLPAAVPSAGGPTWGKAILTAARDLVVSPGLAAHLAAMPPEQGWEAVADLPLAGSQVLATQPVLTVFAAGSDPAAVAESLQSRLADVERLIDQHC